ncbi:uncharacterized protein LOC144129639 [Amblyomma americanum]
MTETGGPSTEQNSHPQDVASLRLRLPSFWPQNPQVSFLQIETLFSLHRITSEVTRYYQVVSTLPPNHLKTKVLERLMLSEHARLQQLLTAEDPGDRRPFQLLRWIRQLLGERDVPYYTAPLREPFLNCLPQPIRLVLTAAGDVTLDRTAELANFVL